MERHCYKQPPPTYKLLLSTQTTRNKDRQEYTWKIQGKGKYTYVGRTKRKDYISDRFGDSGSYREVTNIARWIRQSHVLICHYEHAHSSIKRRITVRLKFNII